MSIFIFTIFIKPLVHHLTYTASPGKLEKNREREIETDIPRHAAGVGWPCCFPSRSKPCQLCTFPSDAESGPTWAVKQNRASGLCQAQVKFVFITPSIYINMGGGLEGIILRQIHRAEQNTTQGCHCRKGISIFFNIFLTN